MSRPVRLVAAVVLALSVLPAASAAAAAPSARLQPELVAQLDAAAPTDAVTVFVHADDVATSKAAVLDTGLRPVTTWDRIGVAVAVGTPAQIRQVAQVPGVTYLEADQELAWHLDTSHQATRGDEARTYTDAQGEPIDGRGTSIAIIDTGIDGHHEMFTRPDGSSKVVRNLKSVCPDVVGIITDFAFTEQCMVDDPSNSTDTLSTGGHGTHVASIAAGVDVTTADGRELHGAAPGASLIGLSVGQTISIFSGNTAMDWVLEHHADPCGDGSCPPIEVTNHSYGPAGGGSYDPDSATAKLQDALVAEGVTVVWAAGNSGGDGSDNRTNPPGESPTPGVLMVANYDDGDTGTRDGSLHSTSSRGEAGDPTTYPDLSAPGTTITAACSLTLPICQTGFDTRDPANYGTISGTSMAAPHVAGIVAQLVQSDPSLTPGAIEDLLEDTAYEFSAGAPYEPDPRNTDGETSFDKGHGLVDAAAAVATALGEVPSEPAEACATGHEHVVDPEGDATAVIADTPLPSEPALDVTEAWLSSDAAASDVTFHVHVADLPESPLGTQGEGEFFDFEFTYAGAGYYVTLNRSASGGERFTLGQFTPARTTLAELTGTFDPATDEITALLPAATINEVTDGEAPVVAEGEVFAGLRITSRRDLLFVVPNADTATGACPYVVGAEHQAEEPNSAPMASFTFDPVRPRAGEEVTFDASGSSDPDGDALSYSWDFGDGATAEGVTVTHVFDRPGPHRVTLTVDDGRGGSDTQVRIVRVRGRGNPGS